MRALGIVLIVLVAIAVIAVLCVLVHMSVTSLRARAKRKADRQVPWTPYCRPVPPLKPTYLEIGVERVTEDGRTLSHVQMSSVDLNDDVERAVAESAAKLRAEQYNDSKVGM